MPDKIKFLIIHCTATPEGREVSAMQIRKMHTSPPPEGRGWKQVGYADMIHLDGMLENLVPHDENEIVDPWEITNGATGLNNCSRHVVYVGGTDNTQRNAPKDTRTKKQEYTMQEYVRFFLKYHPACQVAGHYQFAPKACPSFDVPKWLQEIGIPQANIYTPAK